MLPRKNLKIETVKYAFFNVLVNDSTHLLQEKNRPKNVHSFLRWEENYRRINNLNALYYTDNCLPRTGTWIKAKRHRRNLKSDWRTKRTGKKRVWNRVFGCWSGQIGTNRLFWVVGRDVGFRSPNRDCPDEIGTVGKHGRPSRRVDMKERSCSFLEMDEQKLPFTVSVTLLLTWRAFFVPVEVDSPFCRLNVRAVGRGHFWLQKLASEDIYNGIDKIALPRCFVCNSRCVWRIFLHTSMKW